MKKLMPFLLSAVVLSSTVACRQQEDQISDTPRAANNNQTTLSKKTNNTSSNLKTSQNAIPAGTTFETTLQKDLSTGKHGNNERFTLKVKDSLLGGVDKNLKDAEIEGHLENVVKAAKGKKASLNLVFDDIKFKNGGASPIDVTLVNTQIETKTKGKFLQNAGIILGGAVAGKFLGDKTKFKHGALAGGAAATAFVLSSPGGEVELKKGTVVKLKLTKPLDATP
jgi:hypothetical protein